MNQGQPLVKMENIHKSFGKVKALKGVDFEVYEQEVVGLLGDNGAGKSTLIKILSGVYQPDEGNIYIQGKKVEINSPEEARELGIETVHQDLSLVEKMSVVRNFFLGKELTKRVGFMEILDLKKMSYECMRGLKEVGIELRSPTDFVSTLSGGQRQAIAIGRAVYFGARILILDEPLRNLSIREQRTILNHIREARNKGSSVIFITHNIHHVCPVADRIVLLENGEKLGEVKAGELTPEEIAECIANGQMIEK
ncbi:MAG: simple sugar transport system ATP-binding protein [Candidatus Atribacteria bacterium]|jgi:simple sugar transport system ATP-binding protein|nr:simple sugar transport system ATP-binding protein [Candidatus Atribacteria bacterium]